MTKLFINIKELIQVRDASIHKISETAMNILPTIKKASLLIDNEEASNFGLMDKISNFTITKEIPSYFSFGTNLTESVYIKRNKF